MSMTASFTFAVYRHDLSDRFLDREEMILGGFASAREAMDVANDLRRGDPLHRYSVGGE